MNADSIAFLATELQRGGHLAQAHYHYIRRDAGWQILRNGEPFMDLPSGYRAVKTRFCGVCATDLARHHLPFPLPQVTGHEVVIDDEGQDAVVDINASHKARGLNQETCPFCQLDLASHCPARTTLGIDRLPGGFAPFLLAPKAGILPVPKTVSSAAASLTEPLAAAWQAVIATGVHPNDQIAVLGPRRLGMLLIAALASHRIDIHQAFKLTAIARHQHLLDLASSLGSDTTINNADSHRLLPEQDIVFDTTGSPSGLALALKMATRSVHLKSTHGQPVLGMAHLSDMVIDEIALMPFSEARLGFHWPNKVWTNRHILVSPSVDRKKLPRIEGVYHQLPFDEALTLLQSDAFAKEAALPRFDLAIVENVAQADQVIRLNQHVKHALVRPQGAILLHGPASSELGHLLRTRNLELHSSRCGPFAKALDMLANHPDLCRQLENQVISHRLPLSQLPDAFAIAGDSRSSLKVLVDCQQS